MMIALVHRHYNEAHLEAVKAEMVEMGAPKIRAVWMESLGLYAAIEGCHRIRAAKMLRLTPEIIDVDYSDEAAEGSESTIAEICDGAYDAEVVEF